jgi:hypothetical protein
VIPELSAPTYADLRNKRCIDDSEFLGPQMKNIMKTKLYNSNQRFSKFQKILVNIEMLSRKNYKEFAKTIKKRIKK